MSAVLEIAAGRVAASSADPGRAARQRWLAWHASLLLLAGALLLIVFEATPLDAQLAGLFYDPATLRFPLRHAAWAEALYHGSKAAAILVGCLGFAYALARSVKPRPGWPRRNAVAAMLGLVLVPLGVVLLKHLMQRHCPWSLEAFGGSVPATHLWQALPAGVDPGQCFPAGHAAGGFVWLTWAAMLRPAGRRHARVALVSALAMGAAMGLVRMAQGAHFLSHTLWSAWFAWAVTVALVALLRADVRLREPGREAR